MKPQTKSLLASAIVGGAGAATGHFAFKKSGWKGPVVGGIVGMALPWIYTLIPGLGSRPIGPVQEALESDDPIVLPSNKKVVTFDAELISDMPLSGRTYKSRGTSNILKIAGPKGWLGALIAHGMLVQSKIYKYMYKRTHISWDLKLDQGSHGHVKRPKDRFAHKYCEFPPPVHISRTFLTNDGVGNMNDWDMWDNHRFNQWYETGRPIARWYQQFNNFYAVASDRYSGCQFVWYPDWSFESKRYDPLYPGGKIKIPQGADYKNYRRMWLRYYRNARWLVWCGEMMRIHSGIAGNASDDPPGWKEYCTRWAIGCSSKSRYQDRPHLDMKAQGTSLKKSYVRQALKALMERVPMPGVVPSGSEIVRPRRLADWPGGAGRMQPSFSWPNSEWKNEIRAKSSHDYLNSPSYKITMGIAKVGTSIAAAYTGGAAGAVIGGMIGAMVEQGIGALFGIFNKVFAGGQISGSDFGQLAIDIVAGQTGQYGYTYEEAVNAWNFAKDNLWDQDEWAFADDLLDQVAAETGLADDLEYLIGN